MTLDEAQAICAPVARKIGLLYGANLSVERREDILVFVDGQGDLVMPQVCADEAEIDSGEWMKMFADRAFLAALIQRTANA